MNDGGMKADVWLNAATELSGSLQYEKWNSPGASPRGSMCQRRSAILYAINLFRQPIGPDSVIPIYVLASSMEMKHAYSARREESKETWDGRSQ